MMGMVGPVVAVDGGHTVAEAMQPVVPNLAAVAGMAGGARLVRCGRKGVALVALRLRRRAAVAAVLPD